MQSASGPPLPAAVSGELARLEAQVGQVADPWARRQLAELGDTAAVWVLRKIGEPPRTVWNLSAYIKRMANKETMQRNAAGIPTAESAACDSGPLRASQQEDSISGPFNQDDVQMKVQSPDGEMAVGLSNQAMIEPVCPARQLPCGLQYHGSPVRTDACIAQDLVEMEVESSPGWISPGLQNHSPFSAGASPMANRGRIEAGSPARDFTPSHVRDITKRVQQMDGPSGRVRLGTPPSVAIMNDLRATASPQMLALGELDFDRIFLILVYLADKKIEDVVEDASYIRYLKSLPMDCFESAIWNKFGEKSIAASDRRKNLDWDPSKTRLYHCNIEKRSDSIVTLFKGPYLENTRTHLQKVVGDDSVLIVKFADIDITGNMQTTLVSTVHFTARLLKMEFFWVCDDIAFSFIKMEGRRRSKKKKRRKSKTKNSLLLSCAILFALSLGGTRMSLTSSPATRLIRPAGSLCTYILLLLWRNICPGFL